MFLVGNTGLDKGGLPPNSVKALKEETIYSVRSWPQWRWKLALLGGTKLITD